MWTIVLFDLPTDTKDARKAYTNFRKSLLSWGFTMIQYSVYARACPSEEAAQVQVRRVKSVLPDDGQVRIISLTDRQYSKILCFFGSVREATETAPKQLEFF